MLSYEVYKVIHVMAFVIGLSCLGISFFSVAEQVPKKIKIFGGIASAFIFIAGMGLLARIGVNHGEGFPGWVYAKMALWAVIAIGGPICSKRIANNRPKLFVGFILVTFVAVILAVFKPF